MVKGLHQGMARGMEGTRRLYRSEVKPKTIFDFTVGTLLGIIIAVAMVCGFLAAIIHHQATVCRGDLIFGC